MDQKLLDALGNLSLALEQISTSLKDKSEAQSATAKALKGGDFIKEIKEINIGVKQLQKDTKEILKNQKTIINLAQKKSKDSKTSDVEKLGGDKKSQSNFKEGIGVILLIAVAVLAIGFAFKLIGGVNFASVIALSIALAILSISFAKTYKVLKEVGFNYKKDSIALIVSITSIATSIMIASVILSFVTPITFSKLFTIVFLGAAFAMLAPSIAKLISAFAGVGFMALVKAVIFLPLVLGSIALGIAFASWAFQLIKPITLTQFLTAVGIGLVFTIVSFGIKKLLGAFKRIGMASVAKAVIFLPLVLPAIALGIALASHALQLIKPISWSQFFTTVFIGIVFTVLAYGLNKIIGAFKGMDPGTTAMAAIMIPIVFVGLAYAISFSSIAFNKIKPISFGQFLTALGISAVFVVLSFGIQKIVRAISRTKWQDIPKLPVFFTLVSIAIMLSSYILSVAKIIPVANLFKLALFGAILAGLMMVMTFPIKALSKIGIKDLLMGSLGVIVVSAAIMVSSLILGVGNYKNYPKLGWALGVGLAIILFSPAILLLGAIAASGFGALVILAGAAMVLVVAATITATSYILAAGKYGTYPPLSWSASVGMSLAAFATGMVLLGGIIIASFGIGGLMLAAGSEAVLMVAETIVKASLILDKGKYSGGPTLEWAGGIALALAAFSPLYLMLMANGIMKIFGGGGVGPADFAKAIITVSGGIVLAAKFFAANTAAFKNGPPKAWAEGVGIALGAFSPVYKMLMANGVAKLFGGGGVGPEDFAKAIKTVSRGIIDAAWLFAGNKAPFKEGNYPSKKWGEGVGAALGAFAPVFKAMNEDRGWFESGDDVLQSMLRGIKYTTNALIGAGKAFFKAGDIWGAFPTDKWASGVKSTVIGFMDIFKEIQDRGLSVTGFTVYAIILRGAISNIATAAKILYDSEKYFKFKLDPSWVMNLMKNVIPFAALAQQLDKILGYDEKTTLKQGGFMGFGQTTSTVTTRKMKDISIVNRVVSQMVDTARLLWSNQKFFKFQLDKNWVYDLHWNLENYAKLTRILEKILTINEVKTMNLGIFGKYSMETTRTADVGTVNKIVNQMVITAGILHKNRQLFGFKIDPNYMRSIASNVLAFADLSKQLELKQKGQSRLDEMLGLDPISRAAKGMVKIASAYDTLAKAVRNFSNAINSLNSVKLYQFRMLTGNLAMLSAMDSGMFSNMLKVLETRAGVFAKLIDIQERRALANMPQVRTATGGQAGAPEVRKAAVSGGPRQQKDDNSAKFDKMIFLLEQISNNSSGINDFLQNSGTQNKDMTKSDG